MKFKDYIFYGIIVALVVLFLASAIIFKVFNVEILPSQFYGALIGVFITAIITAFLLRGQTEGDEKREKSLKVFETQKEKYNNFINEMWKIWDKRSVRLEEVNELLRMVSQDIVLYTKPKTVNEILSHLTQIAKYANGKETDNTDEFSKKIQEHIFGIINSLAKEINLGGEINEEFRKNLNALEDKLLPYINSKKYVKRLMNLFAQELKICRNLNLNQMKQAVNGIFYGGTLTKKCGCGLETNGETESCISLFGRNFMIIGNIKITDLE
jgi:gas vesicle protein